MSEQVPTKQRLRPHQFFIVLVTAPFTLVGLIAAFLWESLRVGWEFGRFTFEQFADGLPERDP